MKKMRTCMKDAKMTFIFCIGGQKKEDKKMEISNGSENRETSTKRRLKERKNQDKYFLYKIAYIYLTSKLNYPLATFDSFF